MKKLEMLVLTVIMFFSGIGLVYAACEAQESNKLSSLAVNVKASYEVLQRDIADEPGFNPPDGLTIEEYENYVSMEDYFRIYITNLTDELYVTVTDGVSKEVKTYNYSDSEEGTITFDLFDKSAIRQYTIDVYSSDKTGCSGTKLYTTYVTTPMYNYFSEDAACNDAGDFYACHQYLSVPIDTYDVLVKRVQSYKDGLIDKDGEEIKEQNTEEKKGLANFLKKNKAVIIVTSICVIGVGGLVTVIVVKKQRSKRI